ncbi:Yip1-domain-containing protein [Backusella circina FSU 941]|nr:Yip1-domain-containing protein [Backusella circina FSU 941]
MANKNQYNVLVDMEDAAYTQPATIESDGLEFQDFSGSSGMNNKSSYSQPAPPPPSNTTSFFDAPQPTNNNSNRGPIWSLDYYSRFFDVDTSQVIERCLKSMYPVGDFAADTLNNQPDLYGPFWISTTVVFSVFVCSSLAGSLAAYIAGQPHVYDFRTLSVAVFVIYMYGFFCPAAVWASTKYFGCQPSLLEIVNYYGYGLSIWIPVSLLCIIPNDIARWVFVGVAFTVTAVFLVKNLYIVISRADAKISRIILLAMLGAHVIFALILKQQKIWEKQKSENEKRKKQRKTYVNQEAFRSAERNFKSRNPPPDFSKVVDVTKEDQEHIIKVPLTQDLESLSRLFGDNQHSKTCQDAYVLKNVPGLIVIPNAMTAKAQRHLIKQCLSVYSLHPNISNLDTHYNIPESGLWSLFEKQKENTLKPEDALVYKKENKSLQQGGYSSDNDKDSDDSNSSAPPDELIKKLRWVTLGYQYDWLSKTYHPDKKYAFPQDIAELSKRVVKAIEGIGYTSEETSWRNEYKGSDFIAEAGLLNYYQYKDTLMGHVDRSEVNTEAPLVSLSLGNACIYLIGGPTKETVPIPLYLRSGDIIVMTGPCRKAYHGVPLIIEGTLPDYLDSQDGDADWAIFGEYMRTTRINLNIRQVNTSC